MEKKKVTVILDVKIHDKLKKLAIDKHIKVSEAYEEVLEEGLKIIKNQSTLEDYDVKVE